MITNIKTFLFSLLAFSVLVAPSGVAVAQIKGDVCSGANFSFNDPDCNKNNPQQGVNSIITQIVNILSVIVGIIAVIMIIVGGFKFITSGGDSGRVASARNTVIYAIVGLIIVALAQIIVRFVLSKAPAG